jgi:hypothetical protein
MNEEDPARRQEMTALLTDLSSGRPSGATPV